MTEAEGVHALRACLTEAKKRFVANLPTFQVLVVDKDGVRKLDDISP